MNDRAAAQAWSLANPLAAELAPISAQRSAEILTDRACAELRRGRLLALRVHDDLPDPAQHADASDPARVHWWLAAAVEMLDETRLRGLHASLGTLRLLLSAERLQALDWPAASTARALEVKPAASLEQLHRLAAVAPGAGDRTLLGEALVADPAMLAALHLCKRARLLPALLLLPLGADQGPALETAQVMRLDPAELALAAPAQARALRRVSDARVPIAAHEDCTLVLFRELDGDAEHVAIVVGQPPTNAPVPVRLHSACLTGDLLDSLRCDCGPQLQVAIERLAETGGVLLYLAQEGRGTGLANKLRAYRLQDGGLDTLQADRHLGFREDERDFQAAAAMLQELGYRRISLLTNNPHKIDALRLAGIEVVDRQPLLGPVNRHNARYVRTKQQMAGHLGADD